MMLTVPLMILNLLRAAGRIEQNAAQLQAAIAGHREQRDALTKNVEVLRDSRWVRARHSTLTQF
jgi:hypothetical protein